MNLFPRQSSRGFIDVAVVAVLIIVSAVIAVPVTYYANKTNTDTRDRACNWICTNNCGCGCSDNKDLQNPACNNAPAPPPANPPPAPGGGCVSTGCTYYSCTNQLLTDSCGARVLSGGFCSTNYPASNPCGIGTTPTSPPSTGPPTSGGTAPSGGACPSGQIQCGGCLNNLCYPASEGTCNTQIQNKCNTNPSCAGDGVFAAAGQSCCAGLTLYSNGRCGGTPASCIGAGGSKPSTGGSCCSGLFDCGTSCATLSSSCPAQPSRPSIAPGTQCNNVGGCFCADSGKPMNNTWTCPAQVVLTAGATCPNGESTCLCTSDGKTITSGNKCAGTPTPIQPPATTPYCDWTRCTFGCTSTTSTGGTCASQPAAIIDPGVLCSNATGCTCRYTDQSVRDTWTCEKGSNGKACGNHSHCQSGFCKSGVCADLTAPISIAAGETCSSASGCTCPNTTVITNGVPCPKLANGSACTAASQCTSGYCSGTCKTPPATTACASPNTCISTGLCTGNGGTLVSGYSCSTSGQSCCFYPSSPTVPAIPAGSMCTNPAGCTCADTGKPMNNTWTCPAPNGAFCTNPWDCSSGICITNICRASSTPAIVSCSIGGTDVPVGNTTCESDGDSFTTTCTATGKTKTNCPSGQTCQGNSCKTSTTATRLLIDPGQLCTSQAGCTCKDTGKPMNNTWTCPGQVPLTPGATCPNGESTCLCPNNITITSGNKCAPATTSVSGTNCSLPHGQYDSNVSMYCCTAATGAQAKYQTAACGGAQGYYLGGADLPDGTWCTPGSSNILTGSGGCGRCASKQTYYKSGNTYCGVDTSSIVNSINAGDICKNANGCVCSDTGRIVQNNWTCPKQQALVAGETCSGGDHTCLCDGTTIGSGDKCVIALPKTCPAGKVCRCTNATNPSSIKNITAAATDRSCNLASDLISIEAPATACTIGSKTVALSQKACNPDGANFEFQCTELGSVKIACKAGESCLYGKCQLCIADGQILGQGARCCTNTSYQKGNNLYCGKSPVTATSCKVGGNTMSSGGTACKSNGDSVEYVCVANGSSVGNAPDDTGAQVLQRRTCRSGWTCQGNACVAKQYDTCTLPHGQLDAQANLFCCEGRYLSTACSGAQGYYVLGNNLPDGTWCTSGSPNLFSGAGGCSRCANSAAQRTDGKWYCGASPSVYCSKICPADTFCNKDRNGGFCKSTIPATSLNTISLTPITQKDVVNSGEVCSNPNGCACIDLTTLDLRGTPITKFDVCGSTPTPAGRKTCQGQCISTAFGSSCQAAGEKGSVGLCPLGFGCCSETIKPSQTQEQQQCIGIFNATGAVSGTTCQQYLVSQGLLRAGTLTAPQLITTGLSDLNAVQSTMFNNYYRNAVMSNGATCYLLDTVCRYIVQNVQCNASGLCDFGDRISTATPVGAELLAIMTAPAWAPVILGNPITQGILTAGGLFETGTQLINGSNCNIYGQLNCEQYYLNAVLAGGSTYIGTIGSGINPSLDLYVDIAQAKVTALISKLRSPGGSAVTLDPALYGTTNSQIVSMNRTTIGSQKTAFLIPHSSNSEIAAAVLKEIPPGATQAEIEIIVAKYSKILVPSDLSSGVPLIADAYDNLDSLYAAIDAGTCPGGVCRHRSAVAFGLINEATGSDDYLLVVFPPKNGQNGHQFVLNTVTGTVIDGGLVTTADAIIEAGYPIEEWLVVVPGPNGTQAAYPLVQP